MLAAVSGIHQRAAGFAMADVEAPVVVIVRDS